MTLNSTIQYQEPDKIWWEHIGKSVRLIRDINHLLVDHQSFILNAPNGFPWDTTFEETVRKAVQTISPDRMMRIVYPGDTHPDTFCFSEFCPEDVATSYWPSMSKTAFLCENQTLPFHRSFIWIRGVQTADAIKKWNTFISSYNKDARKKEIPDTAIFIVEIQGTHRVKTPLPVLLYEVQDSDCRIFGLEILSEKISSGHNSKADVNLQQFASYLAELAVQIGNNDPELCDRLLENAESMLLQPVETTREVVGLYGKRLDDHLIESAVWKAQIKEFFPLLERHRLDIIGQYSAEISIHLPIQDVYGDVISDPEDLEFRHLLNFYFEGWIPFSKEEKDKIVSYRDIRNTLSHNKTITHDQLLLFFKNNSVFWSY